MEKKKHFLVVTYPLQSHINPALHLAKRLPRTTGATVTFSAPVSAHRRMFSLAYPNQELHDGLITYVPFSDGYDDGYKRGVDDAKEFLSKSPVNGRDSVSELIGALAARGRPVTCVIYTIMLSWAADVAQVHKIPSVPFWIQPATVFASYYHFFHGFEELILAHAKEPGFSVSLPGLQPLQIRDLPSFVTDSDANSLSSSILILIRELFQVLDKEATSAKPKVLLNTFDALEADVFCSVNQIEMIAIGPVLPFLFENTEASKENTNSGGGDLFKSDEKGYMEWLDRKPEGSVVYISFGSMSAMSKKQMEEILKGLKGTGRPYLWVVRKDNREEGIELEEEAEEGMVVEWCSQVKVLQHPAIGCFVTHCGWNSTLESLACGVPMVGVPQWTDQGTNAKLVEAVWGSGVRGEVNEEGVLEGDELKRCLGVVMGEDGGVEIRRRARMWRDKAVEAIKEGGPSDLNLKAFVEQVTL